MKVKLLIPKDIMPIAISDAIKSGSNDWIIKRLNEDEEIFVGDTTIEIIEKKEIEAIELTISITGGVPYMRKMIKENIQSWTIGW